MKAELSANGTCAFNENELKAKFEFSAAGTCRVFSESRCERWLELMQQVYEE